jgi:transposase
MQTLLNFGADVDSRYVWVACAEKSIRTQRIDNTRAAIGTWLKTLARGSRLGMESTGRYHELLAELADKAGLEVFVINPRDLRRYAQGVGQRGKTDRIDADVIARYVAREHDRLHAYSPPTKEQRELTALQKRRAKLVQIVAMANQSLGGVPCLRQELEQIRKSLTHAIKQAERLMQQTLQKMPEAREAAGQIATIPGFATLSSTCLANSFTRVPLQNSDAAVAQTGFDPRPADSGSKHGRRRLSKRGQSELRRVLFNCARSAARTKAWQSYYQAQLAKGLSATAATVILARKMVRVAFAVFKTGRPFDPLLIRGHA